MLRALILVTVIFMGSSFFTVACDKTGEGLVDSSPQGTTTSSSTSKVALTLNSTYMTINYHSQFTYVAAGGTPPYTFSMSARGAGGTIDDTTGVYTSPGSNGTDEVTVRDAAGNATTATVVVNSAATGSVLTPISSSSTQQFCTTLSGTGAGSVAVACAAIETVFYLSSICGDGTTPTQIAPSGRGYVAVCPNVNNAPQGVALNVQCCSMRTAGTAYSRTVAAASSTGAQVFCGPNENAAFVSAKCGTSDGSSAGVVSGDGRGGYSVSCNSGVTSTVTASCSGSL